MKELKQDTQKPVPAQNVRLKNSAHPLCTDCHKLVERGSSFGSLLTVTQDTFVEFVEKENPAVVVIIHLYQTVTQIRIHSYST